MRPFTLWWKPRRCRKWRHVSDHPTAAAACRKMDRLVKARTHPGSLRAVPKGTDPAAVSFEPDEDHDILSQLLPLVAGRPVRPL